MGKQRDMDLYHSWKQVIFEGTEGMEWTIHWKQTMHDEEIDMGGKECE